MDCEPALGVFFYVFLNFRSKLYLYLDYGGRLSEYFYSFMLRTSGRIRKGYAPIVLHRKLDLTVISKTQTYNSYKVRRNDTCQPENKDRTLTFFAIHELSTN